jgi:tetratricopeptide (TPR) repeat protein
MSPRVRFACVSAALLASGLDVPAFADSPPSRWDRARDPAVGDAWNLHVRVREFIAPLPDEVLGLRELRLHQAQTELEAADAAASADVRLRFDLGQVYEELRHDQRAIDVLQPALAMAPDHPAALEAWLELAFAYARLDRSREERDAYDAYLVRTSDESGRATALLNRAEAEMRLGNLEDAVVGYRDACDAASPFGHLFETGVLARWGLAVALDRSGDVTDAMREALVASQMDPAEAIIDSKEMCGVSPCVFFVPDYERDWYLGLGRAERAKQERDPGKAAWLWKKTEETWADYVSRADPKDRWLSLAKVHLATTQKRRAAAEKRAELHPVTGRARHVEE